MPNARKIRTTRVLLKLKKERKNEAHRKSDRSGQGRDLTRVRREFSSSLSSSLWVVVVEKGSAQGKMAWRSKLSRSLLQELRIHQTSVASKATREFVVKNYKDLEALNPGYRFFGRPSAGFSTDFSRGFASDALSASSANGGLPATVVALKNPTNEIVYDETVHERHRPGDPSKRAFTYFVLTGGRFIYASALRLLLLKFILSMSASRDVLAMASLEVDLTSIEPGATVTVKWRGKPVFIRRRTESDIKLANTVNMSELRDPQPDSDRVQNPEWLVVVGVCTHLGCVPLPNAGDYGGWFCPCHGSHYDISGRIRKGPAPYNLEVPQYSFLEEGKLLVG